MGSTSFLLIAAYWRPRSHFLVATSRTTCSSCALKWLVWTLSSRVTQPIFGTLPFPPLRQLACLRDLTPSSTPLVGASGGRPLLPAPDARARERAVVSCLHINERPERSNAMTTAIRKEAVVGPDGKIEISA